MAAAPPPHADLDVLGKDGRFTLPWRRWFQQLGGGAGGAVGPQGPAGPAGATGPAGPSGADVLSGFDLLAIASLDAPSGGGSAVVTPNTITATASETVSAGAVCHLFTSGGVAKVQNANATDLTKPANGFVLSTFATNASASVYMPGQFITGLSSLTPGQLYWLATTGGQITTTAPTASGNGTQALGWADSSGTQLFFQPQAMTGI